MSYQEPDQASDWKYIEFWIDDSLNPPYVLMLLQSGTGEFIVVDPAEKYKLIYRAGSYDEATFWLAEDEYTYIGGRLIR